MTSGSRMTILTVVLALFIAIGLAQAEGPAVQNSNEGQSGPGPEGPTEDPDFWTELLPPFVAKLVKLRLAEQRGQLSPEEAATINYSDILEYFTVPTDSPAEAWLRFLPPAAARAVKARMAAQSATANSQLGQEPSSPVNGPMDSSIKYLPPQVARFTQYRMDADGSHYPQQ